MTTRQKPVTGHVIVPSLSVAITYRTLPVPAFDEYTARFEAGPVTIGVEYRHLGEAVILEFYGPDARAKFDGVTPAGMAGTVDEDGLSLHVFGTHDKAEYLRFDCFDEAAHYHLLDPHDSVNVVVEHDTDVLGPLLPWALDVIRERLPAMLTEAGAHALAREVDTQVVADIMADVEREAARMLAVGAPVLVG